MKSKARDATEAQFSECYVGSTAKKKKRNVQFYLIHAHLYALSQWNDSHSLVMSLNECLVVDTERSRGLAIKIVT